MIIGIFGDTHDCHDDDIIRIVQEEFGPRGVEMAICTGDIELRHVNRELFKVPVGPAENGEFKYLPVLCVLTKDQAFNPDFTFAPEGWHFVPPSFPKEAPGDFGAFSDPDAKAKLKEYRELFEEARIFSRLTAIPGVGVVYLGHERSDDLFCDFEKVRRFIYEINRVKDGVRIAITGHKHHQSIFSNNNLTWLNPGAVKYSWNGTIEFAIYDTDSGQAVFGRLSSAESRIRPVSVGILSDTFNVDDRDSSFWHRCRKEFDARGVTEVILCGKFLARDIGRPELNGLNVHYYLLTEDRQSIVEVENWHCIGHDNPIVEIGCHHFYVQHGLGSEQGSLSEIQRGAAIGSLMERHSHLDYIVAGLCPEAIYMEGQNYSFIDPGSARDFNRLAVVCLPRNECTFTKMEV